MFRRSDGTLSAYLFNGFERVGAQVVGQGGGIARVSQR
jgi:hypothetical protein